MEEQDENFDPIEAEKKELELLIRNGMQFDVEKRWTGRISKKKNRSFTIQSPPLGVLDRLSSQYIKLGMDEELLKQNALLEAKQLVGRHAKVCAKIVAIAVLGRNPLYKFLVALYSWYFYWRIDSKKLFQLTIIINQMSNYSDFISSIRYLGSVRTTQPLGPDPIEPQSEED